jgi:hypothetical protein
MKSTVEESPTAFWEREVLKERVGWLESVVVSNGQFTGWSELENEGILQFEGTSWGGTYSAAKALLLIRRMAMLKARLWRTSWLERRSMSYWFVRVSWSTSG